MDKKYFPCFFARLNIIKNEWLFLYNQNYSICITG